MQELCDFLIQTPSKTPLLAPRHPADLSNVSCSMLNTPTNYQGKSKRQTAITTAPNLPHPWSCLCPLANPGNSRYAKNTHCYPSQMSYRTWRNSLHSAGICSFTHKATNLPFCPWSSINEQNRITLKKTEGLQNPSPSLPHPNIRKICLFLCFNKGQDYTWSLAGWTWYHSGWLGEGNALLHVPPAAMQLSSAQPFNQAQLSPKDSQQELEEIQPNTPPLLSNKKTAEAKVTSRANQVWCFSPYPARVLSLGSRVFCFKRFIIQTNYKYYLLKTTQFYSGIWYRFYFEHQSPDTRLVSPPKGLLTGTAISKTENLGDILDK